MFSFVGDTVLDPFLGSGTTIKTALELQRSAIGYEINKDFLKTIKEKLRIEEKSLFAFDDNVEIVERKEQNLALPSLDYLPSIQDAKPQIDPKKFNFKGDRLYKVVEIINEGTIMLNTGLAVKFLGIKVNKKEDTMRYLQDYLLGKNIFLKIGNNELKIENTLPAYVYLKNKIFVNAYLIKSGLASPDFSENHTYKNKFIKLWKESQSV